LLDIAEELDSIRNALFERGIEFAVCGGMAMAIYGFVRATVDLNLFVKPEDVRVIEDVAATLGFVIEPGRVAKIDAAAGDVMMLDLAFVTADNGDVWDTRQSVTWRDQPLPVVSLDGLIALKRLRGRLQDLADIDHLPQERIPRALRSISG